MQKHYLLPWENLIVARQRIDEMTSRERPSLAVYTLIALISLVFFLIPHPLWASNFEFFDLRGNGTDAGYCSFRGDLRYVTSSLICEFIIILNDVMSAVYNGIYTETRGIIQAVLTLYIVVFGAQILMGTAQIATRDVITRLIKIAAVWVFATTPEYSIGIAFNFYMGFIIDVGQALVNALTAFVPTVCGNDMAQINYNQSVSNMMPLFAFIDNFIYCAFYGTFGTASTKITGFFMVMIALYPPLVAMFTWWIMTTAFAIAKTVLSFLSTLAVLAFLISLSPIFLSLMLFQSTVNFFENWLRYMIAFSVQIILVFAIVILWIIMTNQFISFFNDFANLLVPFKDAQYVGNNLEKSDSWAVCNADFTLARPSCFTDGLGNLSTPPIPPTKVIERVDLVNYIFHHLIALIALSFAFSQLLQKADKIASGITNAGSLTQYTMGFGPKNYGSAAGHKAPESAQPTKKPG
jgi:type IV secretory pathway VirB6-like protein